MSSFFRVIGRFLITAALFVSGGSAGAQPAPTIGEELVEIQMPNAPATQVIEFWEMLTGRRLVRDANLAGPNLTIQVPGRIPKRDAIALIESALLLNGYSIVPLDEKTSTLLGPGRSPLGQAIPLYADPSLLPPGEELASYFMLLNYISPQDALAVFNSYVSLRPQGTIVAVPNSNAIVITDTTTLIRRLIALQRFIDVPGARVLTEFVSLQRADAEKVAEIINKLLEEERQADKATPMPPGVEAPQQAQSPEQAMPVMQMGSIQKLTPLIKIIPDTRTNRILIVAPENRMAYLQRLIRDLDAAVAMEQTLERQLRFVSAGEILPVLQSTLAEGGETTSGTSPTTGGVASFQGSTTGATGGIGGRGETADLLSDPRQDTSPQAVSVGKARIIADRSSNKIIVFGPPELRQKADRIIEMLDQRPKQIYLATVIGQLTLDNSLKYGLDYLVKFQNFTPEGESGAAGMLRNAASAAGLDLLPDPRALLTSNAFPALGGLTIYGTIAESVDVFARFLASKGNFQVIQRPVIYTANNKRAVISVGEERPVPTTLQTSPISTTGNAISNVQTASVSFKDVVLRLEVIPLINSPDEVTLTIAQQNNQVLGSEDIGGSRVPIIGTQRLNTTITVRNRSTIVLGGLISDENKRDESGVPILRDIPGLNLLFTNADKSKKRREIIILIQPFIIEEPGSLAEVQAALRRASRLDDNIQELRPPEVRRAEPVIREQPEAIFR